MRVSVAAALLSALICASSSVAIGAESKKAEKKSPAAAKPIDPILQQLLLTSDADPDSGPPPLVVKFETTIYEGDEARNPKFEWDFGDGTKAVREQNPTHTFKKVGRYTVTVKAKDATGRMGRDELHVEVEAPE